VFFGGAIAMGVRNMVQVRKRKLDQVRMIARQISQFDNSNERNPYGEIKPSRRFSEPGRRISVQGRRFSQQPLLQSRRASEQSRRASQQSRRLSQQELLQSRRASQQELLQSRRASQVSQYQPDRRFSFTQIATRPLPPVPYYNQQAEVSLFYWCQFYSWWLKKVRTNLQWHCWNISGNTSTYF
jgi:hypothetical protein